jgi:hypothetical protein
MRGELERIYERFRKQKINSYLSSACVLRVQPNLDLRRKTDAMLCGQQQLPRRRAWLIQRLTRRGPEL